MAYEDGDLKIYNPDKELSKEITLAIMIAHRDAITQARIGKTPNIELDKISDNDRMFNKVRALNLIISSQRDMVTISRPILYFRSLAKWNKATRPTKSKTTEELQEETPFEKYSCDYNTILKLLDMLKACEKDIIEAELSKTLDDDFILEKENDDGSKKYVITQNFYEMLDVLEDSYQDINLLMLTNKIVSAGIEEDEELSQVALEEEFIARTTEA